jgi:hypothetical protein
MNKPTFLRSNHLYMAGLVILVTGLPLSLFLMSISQFVLAGAFFLEGNPIEKFKRFFRNKAAMLIAGIWLLHVIGLLWTTDLAQGWNDIRIKLPLLVLTVIISGSEPLSEKQFRVVLTCFIGAVFIGTLISMAVLTGIIRRDVTDIRDVFIFKISHIRFALFTCISIFSLLYFVFSRHEKLNTPLKALCICLATWFFIFLFAVESLTGLSVSVTILTLLLLCLAWKRQSHTGKTILLSVAALIPALVFYSLYSIYREYSSARLITIDLNAKTAQGNSYTFNLDNPEMENGFPAYVYMCDTELRRSWNRRSAISFDSLDGKGQKLKYTLIRFLASKGLRKDSVAMTHLSDEEIRSIESGIPNVSYQSASLKARLMQVAWEYDQFLKGGDPSGHSLMQRMESWKAAVGVIKANLLFGVGTGDAPAAVHGQYALMNSRLSPSHYLRAHNQYLSIAVAFGIAGLAFFLFAFCYPLFSGGKRNYFYVVFFLTVILSMLTEDTLETQPGATFFAFFNALFLFARPRGTASGTNNE